MDEFEPLILCLGVPKAATTWVHRQFEAHPQIACTTTKEIGYWLRNYQRGPQWYADQFARTQATRVYAEVTPHYLDERALQRIARDVGDVRFIVVLRDPYERAYSEYLNALRNGELTGTFAQALKGRDKILRNSMYGQALSTYLQFFELDRLHVIMYESIRNEPARVVEEMYRFAGVDPGFVPDRLHERVNVGRTGSGADRWLKRLEKLSKRAGLRRRHLVRLRFDRVVEGASGWLARRNPPSIMSQADRALMAPAIEPDLSRLEDLLGRDVSGWRAARGARGAEIR